MWYFARLLRCTGWPTLWPDRLSVPAALAGALALAAALAMLTPGPALAQAADCKVADGTKSKTCVVGPEIKFVNVILLGWICGDRAKLQGMLDSLQSAQENAEATQLVKKVAAVNNAGDAVIPTLDAMNNLFFSNEVSIGEGGTVFGVSPVMGGSVSTTRQCWTFDSADEINDVMFEAMDAYAKRHNIGSQ